MNIRQGRNALACKLADYIYYKEYPEYTYALTSLVRGTFTGYKYGNFLSSERTVGATVNLTWLLTDKIKDN